MFKHATHPLIFSLIYLNYVLRDNLFWRCLSGFLLLIYFGRYLSGPGYPGLITFGYCFAKNQALRIPIAIVLS